MLHRAFWLVLLICAAFGPARAAEPADAGVTAPRVDLKPYFELIETDKREATLGRDLSLKAKSAGPEFRWLLLNIINTAAEPRQIVIAFPDQGFAGSGLFWPAAPGRNVAGIALPNGTLPQPLPVNGFAAYAFELAPGAVTAAAFEIAGPGLPAAAMWQRDAFAAAVDRSRFFHGGLLGIAVLFALGILALYVIRRHAMVLAGGGFALVSAAYLLLETGHLSALVASLDSRFLTVPVARAVLEGLMAALLILYLETVADVRRQIPVLGDTLLLAGGLAFAIPVYGFVEPLIASSVARLAFGAVAAIGLAVLFVVWRREDIKMGPALATWIPLSLWTLLALAAMLANPERFQLSPIFQGGLALVIAAIGVTMAHFVFSDGIISRRDAEETWRRAQSLDGARASVWSWEPDTAELFVGGELWQELGYDPEDMQEIDGEGFLELVHPSDRSAYIVALRAVERDAGEAIECDFRLRDSEGGYRWFELRARMVEGGEEAPAACAGTLTDVTEAKHSMERMLDGSIRDHVTGLPNQALFLDRLGRAMAAPGRAENVNIYVLVVEIDRFRALNDTLGREAGDEFMAATGRRLAAATGPEGSVARLPGSQFAVLFSTKAGGRDIVAFSAELRRAVTQTILVDGEEFFLTASIGVSQLREPEISAERLLKDAVLALYEAKRRGNDMIEVFQPSMRDDRAELAVLESELRRAVAGGEIEVHYQPVAQLADMNLAGFEALPRWRHPKLGLLAPESFMRLAEHTGLIKDIGRLVFNEAGRQLGIWQRSFRVGQPFFIAVTIPSAQLVSAEMVGEIEHIIQREGLQMESLKIQVGEPVVAQAPELASQILRRFRDIGAGLCCEDFGGDHSSLSSLLKMPFDTLKIGRSLIKHEIDGGKKQAVLEAVIALAHDLGLKILAHGIDNQEQVDRLGEMGCDMGQGHFICRPLTARQVSDTLTGMPYASGEERTAITQLWEVAAKEREHAPVHTRLSSVAMGRRTPDAPPAAKEETPARPPARPEREESLSVLAQELFAKEVPAPAAKRKKAEAGDDEGNGAPGPRPPKPKRRKKRGSSEQSKPH